MKRHYFWLLSLLAITAFVACNKKDAETPFDPVAQAAKDDKLIKDYITANGITDVKKDDTTALYYKILEPGTSPGDTIKLNDRLSIAYQGKLLNGYVFNDTKGENTTLDEARLQNLIKGWQLGLRKISKGGKILLFIPSALGYGTQNYNPIPPNSVLIFEIKLSNFYY